MNPKIRQAAAKLLLEASRFKARSDELIVKAYHSAGLPNAETARLIRDHEIRAESFKEAARLVQA